MNIMYRPPRGIPSDGEEYKEEHRQDYALERIAAALEKIERHLSSKKVRKVEPIKPVPPSRLR